MDINALVGAYVKARDKKKEIQDRHKQELVLVNEVMDELESTMLKYFETHGINSAATDAGTAYKSLRESYSVADPVLFREWVQEQGDLSFFESRASKTAVEAYIAETGEIPPGVKYSADMSVGFRRS